MHVDGGEKFRLFAERPFQAMWRVEECRFVPVHVRDRPRPLTQTLRLYVVGPPKISKSHRLPGELVLIPANPKAKRILLESPIDLGHSCKRSCTMAFVR